MKKSFFLCLFLSTLFIVRVKSQDTSPADPVYRPGSQVYQAFTNALIFPGIGKPVKGTLLIYEGRVVAIGENIKIPKGTVIRDLQGACIYPSFIEPYSSLGAPPVQKPERKGPVSDRKDQNNRHWNAAVQPERKTAESIRLVQDSLDKFRKAGFGIVNTHVPDGIFRGTSTVITLGEENLRKEIISAAGAHHMSFDKGSSPQDYPSSQMGAIALIRQTLYDANWYRNSTDPKKVHNASLEALTQSWNFPWIFEVKDKLEALRASQIAGEFNKKIIIRGNGDEYQRAAELRKTGNSFIIPAALPKPVDVADPFDAGLVSLTQLKHWELAPHNAKILHENGVHFSFTSNGISDPEEFLSGIRKMVKAGLSPEAALNALTINPAAMLRIDSVAGSLQSGKFANFIIVSDSLFRDKSIILDNYVRGVRFRQFNAEMADIRGTYDLNINHSAFQYQMIIGGERYKPEGKAYILGTRDTIKLSLHVQSDLIHFLLPSTDSRGEFFRLSGKVHFRSGIWDGKGQLPDGRWVSWSAIKHTPHKVQLKDTSVVKPILAGPMIYPFTGYGTQSLPAQEVILIKNATVWTCEEAGLLKNADVLIRNGKIEQVGNPDISKIREKIRFIDGTGRHVTPGIIDEHSHIAISKGVNEGTQAITSEVRIGDVINSEDINIYRQLAGGVTTAQLLHGSANPIGGQSAIIKLKWGYEPEEMKLKEAPGFIKFALGENVKQANWGDMFRDRFPQTRMGVEQVYYDAFYRAKKYQAEWDAYNLISVKEREKKKIPAPRKDLELDALVEILKGSRFITCHSYVQSEINMLMHVADSMGFRINTFTHILEGYKLADKLKAHGAAASTFSDWWGYKFEVNDAIPYNAAILNEQGVLTAINSDDAEMGRRLNQEAAKTIKYGGVSEIEALKMITINPAKMLHIDQATGSIKPGKDADIVIWSGNPLSVDSKVEQTIIDGAVYYDRESDLTMRTWVEAERSRLINKMLQAVEDGEKPVKPSPKREKHYHCDTMEP